LLHKAASRSPLCEVICAFEDSFTNPKVESSAEALGTCKGSTIHPAGGVLRVCTKTLLSHNTGCREVFNGGSTFTHGAICSPGVPYSPTSVYSPADSLWLYHFLFGDCESHARTVLAWADCHVVL